MFDLIEDVVDIVTRPVRDAVDILEGLTEGEIREKAAKRLGTEIVAGMATGAVIAFLLEDKQMFKIPMRTTLVIFICLLLSGCEDEKEKKYTCDIECRTWILECAKENHMRYCSEDARELGIAKEINPKQHKRY